MAVKKFSGEQERLRIINQLFSGSKRSFRIDKSSCKLLVGVDEMDDCAIYQFGNSLLVLTTDFVRGTGFYLFGMGLLSYFDVGYYLSVANISDIASKGALPIGLMNVVRYSSDVSDDDFKQIMLGIQKASQDYDVPVIGGDIGGYENNVLTATAIGIAEKGKILLRKNVRDGDLLCITGTIGLPMSAITYFKYAKKLGFILEKEEEDILLDSWKRPKASIKEGLLLTKSGFGHAGQDMSDGLKATLDQLSAASKKHFIVYEDKLPIHSITKKLAAFLKSDPVHLASSASVDFQLAFTINENDLVKCEKLFTKNNLNFHVIGKVYDGKSNMLAKNSGEISDFPGIPWDQQVQDIVQLVLNKGDKK